MYFVLSHQKTVFRLYMFCIVQSENVNVIVHIYIVFTPSTVLQFLVGREAVEEEQTGGGSSAEHSVAAPVLPGQ